MRLTNHSSVPVYTVSGSATARQLPEWLIRKRKRSLKNDPEFANRIELLQDFEFEEASCCVRVSEDGQWVMSTDYSKSLHLQVDRSLEFHTPQGCHHITRIPRYGRDLVYDKRAAETLVPAVGVNGDGNGEVFRLNLELGRFMRSYEVDVGGDDLETVGGGALQGGINTGSVNTGAIAEESHNLLAFGTSIGTVEFWDGRSRNRVGVLSVPAEHQTTPQVTALEFHRSGLTIATGTSSGLIYLYDLRSPVPLLKKDQGYDLPIQTLTFLTPSTESRAQQTTEPKILSADKKIIKIWDIRDGAAWTSVEPAVDLNCVAWCKDSGMILTANEGRQQHSFFIPQLGPAPKWCGFLDALVEEMAEDPNDPQAFKSNGGGEVYDNYKFLTTQQLESLNLEHLVGKSNLLRPYMHGYFVSQRLYEEAKLIADPFIWEEERAKKVREKIDQERESRIRGVKTTTNAANVKVNKALAEKMMARDEKRRTNRSKNVQVLNDDGHEEGEKGENHDEEDEGGKINEEDRPGLLKDSRFAALFQDEDFTVDPHSREFKMLNPSTNPDEIKPTARKTAVEEEEEEMAERGGRATSSSSDDDDAEDDDDSDDNAKMKKKGQIRKSQSSRRPTSTSTKQQPPRMQVSSLKPIASSSRPDRSFASRLSHGGQTKSNGHHQQRSVQRGGGRGGISGELGITFTPGQDRVSKHRSGNPSSSDSKRNQRRGNQRYDDADQGEGKSNKRRDQGRRSASGNVFRRM
ncbi:MAG: hypothetical protein M1823_004325 [Watsoniomyces obsoletus]|nr:MAG: hypothetical protein M1823_004325 [Watsoniomyces obsoletus]